MKKTAVFSLIIDASASMSSIRNSILEKINQQILDIQEIAKNTENEVLLDLVFFNTHVDPKVAVASPERVKLLKEADYLTDGLTALNDAIGTTLHRLKTSFDKKVKSGDANCTVVVFTDGLENASKDYSVEDVQRLMDQLNETKGYEVALVGADRRVASAAKDLNFKPENVIQRAPEEMGQTIENLNSVFSKSAEFETACFSKEFQSL